MVYWYCCPGAFYRLWQSDLETQEEIFDMKLGIVADRRFPIGFHNLSYSLKTLKILGLRKNEVDVTWHKFSYLLKNWYVIGTWKVWGLSDENWILGVVIGGCNARLFNLVINEFNLVKIQKMTKLKLILNLWHVSGLYSTMFLICVILCE